MKFWLMKSEPDVFSIDSLEKQGSTGWEGVRNYQARNYMRDQMQLGDLAFFYHSNAAPSGIAGIMKISKTSHPDPTQFDKKSEYYDKTATLENPRWFMVQVGFVKKFPSLLSLETIKKTKTLANLTLVQKGSRLSVMPVDQEHWNTILALQEQNKCE